MSNSFPAVAEKLLELAKKKGAEHSDVIMTGGSGRSVEIRDGNLEQIEGSDGIMISLRVITQQKSAIVSGSDCSRQSLEAMAQKANDIAAHSIPNPYIGLFENDNSALKHTEILDKLRLNEPDSENAADPKNLEKIALEAEASALETSGISKSDGSSCSFSRTNFHLATSNGFNKGYSKSQYSVFTSVIASKDDKMERDYAYEQRTHFKDLPSPSSVGKLASQRATMMLGARKASTGNYPVIFHERISSSIIGHILSAINGEAITRGSSWLLNSMNESIIPKEIDIFEDPHRVSVLGSRPFDAEGLESKKNYFVKNGRLNKWILDLKTSRQLNLEPTGNAMRGGASSPTPGVGNIQVTHGEYSLEELMKLPNEGLMVCSLMGSSINPNSGDYSRGVSGFWFENGEIKHPVNECTIAGNLKDMIKSVVLANDSRSHLSRVVPSLLVENMRIAGN